MIQFLKQIARFSIPVIPYCLFAYFILPILLTYTQGPSTKDQILRSFNQAKNSSYEILILGNSRIYRGINPAKFSRPAYNFAHDNDSYNQLYFKLVLLESEGKKFNSLLLGVDYFQLSIKSDSRNYIYNELLGTEYAKDYSKNFEKIRYHVGKLKPKKLKGLIPLPYLPILKNNGQLIREGIASQEDRVTRDKSRLPFQEKYLSKILSYCKQRSIKVYLVMPPLRKNEVSSYKPEDITEFNAYLNSLTDESTVFLNFGMDERFSINDFVDITHLNQAGADKFSNYLNSKIN